MIEYNISLHRDGFFILFLAISLFFDLWIWWIKDKISKDLPSLGEQFSFWKTQKSKPKSSLEHFLTICNFVVIVIKYSPTATVLLGLYLIIKLTLH